NRPRVRNEVAINLQDVLSSFQNLAPAGMQKKTPETLKRQIMAPQKIVHRGAKGLSHQSREFRTKNNAETISLDVPTHDVLGILPAMLAHGCDNRAIHLSRVALSTEHNARCTVTKQRS